MDVSATALEVKKSRTPKAKVDSSLSPSAESSLWRQKLIDFARWAVFRQLQHLHTGSLTIIEGSKKSYFGAAGSSDSASEKGLQAEMFIVDSSCYIDIMSGGSIGAAEAYMTGDWITPDLTALVRIMVRNRDILDQLEGGLAILSKPFLKWFHWLNQNTEKGSKRNIVAHYDLGNDFFKLFLDKSMMYSSAIFPHADASLEEAAEFKLDHICRKLQLSPQDHVVEIGSGWGGFAIYAAKHYGCRVTTTTISDEQYALAAERIEKAGLQNRITLLKRDYRELEGQYDKLVSIEMIEAVGWQYYDAFFQKCAQLLKPNGVMLVQAITIEDQRYEYAKRNVDFIQRYIFPGSCIPSVHALNTASKKSSDLRLVHLEDFAEHYARTLNHWNQRFQRKRDQVLAQGYSDTFLNMWEFYLCYCEGGFAERAIGVAHLMYAKPKHRDEKIIPFPGSVGGAE